MDIKGMRDTLYQLTVWRNQLQGLGAMPPDVTELLKLVEDSQTVIANLEQQKSALQSEIASLTSRKAGFEEEERALASAHAQATATVGSKLKEIQDRIGAAEREAQAKFLTTMHDIELRIQSGQKQIDDLTAKTAAKQAELDKVTADFEAFKKAHNLGGA